MLEMPITAPSIWAFGWRGSWTSIKAPELAGESKPRSGRGRQPHGVAKWAHNADWLPIHCQTPREATMIAYTVRCDFTGAAVAAEWHQWLVDEHLADLLDAGAVQARSLPSMSLLPCRRDHGEPLSLCRPSGMDHYLREHAPRLRDEGLSGFRSLGLSYSRTIGVVHGPTVRGRSRPVEAMGTVTSGVSPVRQPALDRFTPRRARTLDRHPPHVVRCTPPPGRTRFARPLLQALPVHRLQQPRGRNMAILGIDIG